MFLQRLFVLQFTLVTIYDHELEIIAAKFLVKSLERLNKSLTGRAVLGGEEHSHVLEFLFLKSPWNFSEVSAKFTVRYLLRHEFFSVLWPIIGLFCKFWRRQVCWLLILNKPFTE